MSLKTPKINLRHLQGVGVGGGWVRGVGVGGWSGWLGWVVGVGVGGRREGGRGWSGKVPFLGSCSWDVFGSVSLFFFLCGSWESAAAGPDQAVSENYEL